MKKIVKGLILGIIIVSPISYFLCSKTKVLSPISNIAPEEHPSPNIEQKLPECAFGHCPEYFSMDVDKDSFPESVVIIPTAMTQAAGKVWVIKDGRLIFESKEYMRIGINQLPEQIDKGNGFILSYGLYVNNNKDFGQITYVFEDGKLKVKEKKLD